MAEERTCEACGSTYAWEPDPKGGRSPRYCGTRDCTRARRAALRRRDVLQTHPLALPSSRLREESREVLRMAHGIEPVETHLRDAVIAYRTGPFETKAQAARCIAAAALVIAADLRGVR